MRVSRTIAVSLVTGLFVFAAACGGDDDAGAPGGSTTDPTAPAGNTGGGATAPTATAGSAGGGSTSGLGDDTGVVTIGDETWEFDVSVLCLSAFEAFGAAGKAVDGSDVDVDLDLPPNDWKTRSDSADWQPPSIRVGDDENNRDWIAGGEMAASVSGVDPGMSLVTSFKIEGSKASGTATFIDLDVVQRGETPEPVDGTFEFSCDADPYS